MSTTLRRRAARAFAATVTTATCALAALAISAPSPSAIEVTDYGTYAGSIQLTGSITMARWCRRSGRPGDRRCEGGHVAGVVGPPEGRGVLHASAPNERDVGGHRVQHCARGNPRRDPDRHVPRMDVPQLGTRHRLVRVPRRLFRHMDQHREQLPPGARHGGRFDIGQNTCATSAPCLRTTTGLLVGGRS